LRKLPLKDARAILRKNGVPEKEIMKLSRWEVIDVVRTLSTEKVKAGEDGDHKFSRGNRFSIAEHQERYREDCQRIFEVQNKVLASDEVLSSDDAESSDEEEDVEDDDNLDEMGKNLENLLSNKTTSSQFRRQQEEAARKDLQRMIMGQQEEANTRERQQQQKQSGTKRKKGAAVAAEADPGAAKVLRITRTFRNSAGKEYTRTEIVRKPLVVETYVKVRETRDEAFIKQFATALDDTAKEEMKKEKRRIQEQLRRIKRNQEREKLGLAKTPKASASRRSKAKADLNLKCGACGAKGHMRTNKACPMFVGSELDQLGPVNVAMTEKDEEELEREVLELEASEELVKVDDTKITLSSNLLNKAEEIRKKTMQLKVPKKVLKGGASPAMFSSSGSRKRKIGGVEHCDYLAGKNYKPTKRRRTDPVILLASFLENLMAE
jgi:transcription initiation factor TFIID subunit 1